MLPPCSFFPCCCVIKLDTFNSFNFNLLFILTLFWNLMPTLIDSGFSATPCIDCTVDLFELFKCTGGCLVESKRGELQILYSQKIIKVIKSTNQPIEYHIVKNTK